MSTREVRCRGVVVKVVCFDGGSCYSTRQGSFGGHGGQDNDAITSTLLGVSSDSFSFHFYNMKHKLITKAGITTETRIRIQHAT